MTDVYLKTKADKYIKGLKNQRAILIALVFVLGLILISKPNADYMRIDNILLKRQNVSLEKQIALKDKCFLQLVDKIYSDNGEKKHDSRKK